MSRPRCPNHHCELTPTDEPRWWICPISDAQFECSVDTAAQNRQRKLNLAGQIEEVESWKIKPGDGSING